MARAARKEKTETESLRAVTGLVAVVVGIVAVVILTIVAIEMLDNAQQTEAALAIATAAFGIISTLITAYLGIKATANSSQEAAAAAAKKDEEATLARYEADIEHSRASRLKQEIDKGEQENRIPQDLAERIRQADAEAEAEARGIKPPS